MKIKWESNTCQMSVKWESNEGVFLGWYLAKKTQPSNEGCVVVLSASRIAEALEEPVLFVDGGGADDEPLPGLHVEVALHVGAHRADVGCAELLEVCLEDVLLLVGSGGGVGGPDEGLLSGAALEDGSDVSHLLGEVVDLAAHAVDALVDMGGGDGAAGYTFGEEHLVGELIGLRPADDGAEAVLHVLAYIYRKVYTLVLVVGGGEAADGDEHAGGECLAAIRTVLAGDPFGDVVGSLCVTNVGCGHALYFRFGERSGVVCRENVS